MRRTAVFPIALLAAGTATGALAQDGSYRLNRDAQRLREEVESMAEKQRIKQRQENVKSTTQRTTQMNQPAAGGAVQDRAYLIQKRLVKLQSDRDAAIQEGKSAEEIALIDASIAKLEQESRLLSVPR